MVATSDAVARVRYVSLLAAAAMFAFAANSVLCRTPRRVGWFSAALLFLYAVPFSFAYNTLTTGTGALILFTAVQAMMLVAGLAGAESALVCCSGSAWPPSAAAIHNLGEEAMGVSCRLMQGGIVLEEVEIYLEANGQETRYIEELFTGTDTSDFVGSVRCTAPGEGMFTGVAVEFDAGSRIFTTLSVVPVQG